MRAEPMRTASRLAIGAVAVFAQLLCIRAAQAMEIRQFDKMAVSDQSEYVGLLVQGAEKVLTDERRPDLAAQVEHLFTTTLSGDRHTVGAVEFESNLAILRENDARNAISHPSDRRLEVEDVMFLTLRKNHIDLPDSFYTVNASFRPKLPPKK
jgi:hypothetical protein